MRLPTGIGDFIVAVAALVPPACPAGSFGFALHKPHPQRSLPRRLCRRGTKGRRRRYCTPNTTGQRRNRPRTGSPATTQIRRRSRSTRLRAKPSNAMNCETASCSGRANSLAVRGPTTTWSGPEPFASFRRPRESLPSIAIIRQCATCTSRSPPVSSKFSQLWPTAAKIRLFRLAKSMPTPSKTHLPGGRVCQALASISAASNNRLKRRRFSLV